MCIFYETTVVRYKISRIIDYDTKSSSNGVIFLAIRDEISPKNLKKLQIITSVDVRYRKPVKFYIFMTSPKIKARSCKCVKFDHFQ